jgi:hypothetical protein
MIDLDSLSTTPLVHPTSAKITTANRLDHFLARIGWKRGEHRVEPGLYALGNPTPDSPVLVTANYTLSFDALRSVLTGVDAYILVLDTRGINVWCAAGKGTFGTEEVVRRVFASGLKNVVRHRKLILPQLGAPGVTAHLVKKQTGFQVEYGPVRADDLPGYFKTHSATPTMRRVEFPLRDRLVLIPVDMVRMLPWMVMAGLGCYLLGGWLTGLAAVSVFLAGLVLFPILLPWIPTHDFSSKGLLLGLLAALPFAFIALLGNPGMAWWRQALMVLQFVLIMPAGVAYITLNFTGATTFTSRSGVRREISTYVPVMAWMAGIGIAAALSGVLLH